ncbi:MAG: hypothetical protein Q8Q08_08235 [Candidatus Omnitrophota bacterium]|nr:hypothetical protein [Candidatus Omnitrophota bacterium]MDZ4242390.1 hypothetical protein [Candidatus Omnitrophota bacterium]
MRVLVWVAALAVVLQGCASTTPKPEVMKAIELRYKKILILPFTRAEEDIRILAGNILAEELGKAPGVTVTGPDKVGLAFIQGMDFEKPDDYGALDLTPEAADGDERRGKVVSAFGPDAVIFGSFLSEEKVVALYVQMINLETGAVVLSFSKEAEIHNGDGNAAVREASQAAAQKIAEFLKENITTIYFHRR